MKTVYTTADTRCPNCSAELTGASDPEGDAIPTPDDISVCMYCGTVVVFNHDMTVRPAKRSDVETLSPQVAFQLAQYVSAVQARLRKERNDKH